MQGGPLGQTHVIVVNYYYLIFLILSTYRKARHSNRRQRKYQQREAVHTRVRNIRNDAHHKAASAITAKPVGKVVVETLNVSGMMKNYRLARSLADASLAGFIAKLEYRCGWDGIAFEKVDRQSR